MRSEYDCIVVGGGPAGSTVATLVAQGGRSVLLAEREKFPRFHIGESLMPETFWTFERLGVLEKMRHAPFVKKYSVQFVSHSGRESAPFFFQEHDPRECSQTWQVERASFDQMLFDNAREHGADCYDQTRVLDVLFENDRATGVRLQAASGEERTVRAQVVVDATGLSAVLANRLRVREEDPHLRKSAVWTYYRDAYRDEGRNSGATLILHTNEKRSWFWYIPLANNITSIGVVGDSMYLLKGRGAPEEIFAEELAKCPALEQRLTTATMVDKHRVAREFSYLTRQQAGDGWVLVGDAFAFIDPIYSSGVFLAFKSGELAADAIIDGLNKGDTSGTQLGRWTADYITGVKQMRRLVDAFYTHEFSFGEFMRHHPQHKGNLIDLLVGRIFHPEAGDIFQDMQPHLDRLQAGDQVSMS
jgi:flavin-dependent dehydrogenase